ncbi:MAG: signal peptidase II [bacterium]
MKFHIILVCVFLLDQITKLIVSSRMVLGARVNVIPYFADIYYSRNKGGIFGFFQSGGEVLTVLSIASLFLLSFFYVYSLRRGGGLLKLGLTLVMAGAFGNVIDRIRMGYVIDFIQLHIGNIFTWHTFNVADSAIVIGAVMLLIYSFRYGSQKEDR